MDLVEYWAQHPPTHVTLAGIVKGMAGSKGGTQPKDRPAPPTKEELQSVVDQFKR